MVLTLVEGVAKESLNFVGDHFLLHVYGRGINIVVAIVEPRLHLPDLCAGLA